MTQQLYGEDVKFDTQMNYLNAILQKISEIQFSIRMGKDCSNEFSNLLFLLTSGIKDPIKEKLRIISVKYAARIEKIRKMQNYPSSSFQWSSDHKKRYRGILINREQSAAILEMLSTIVERLDEMGLLLHREQQTQI